MICAKTASANILGDLSDNLDLLFKKDDLPRSIIKKGKVRGYIIGGNIYFESLNSQKSEIWRYDSMNNILIVIFLL